MVGLGKITNHVDVSLESSMMQQSSAILTIDHNVIVWINTT